MDIVNTAPEEELARIVFQYGEERRSRRVAAAIVRARSRSPIETTDELAGVVASALGRGGAAPTPRAGRSRRSASRSTGAGGARRVPASSGGHPRSRWPRDRDRVPLARGPHRQAVPQRRSRPRDPDEEAPPTVRRRGSQEPEGAEREASSCRAEPRRVSQPARRLEPATRPAAPRERAQPVAPAIDRPSSLGAHARSDDARGFRLPRLDDPRVDGVRHRGRERPARTDVLPHRGSGATPRAPHRGAPRAGARAGHPVRSRPDLRLGQPARHASPRRHPHPPRARHGPADPAGADSPTQTTDQPSGSTGEPPT